MQHLPPLPNPDVLVGFDTRDDAGVYRIREDLAMIQTVDFFTPIVDDPYDYGQIAAANALSDIYAMGGTPSTALNILGVPLDVVDKKAISQIVLGGYEKAKEAGVAILGGHSIKDPELKFGMAVTGFVAPDEVVKNSTAQPGDALVLTKPLGTGILTTALKKEQLPDDLLQTITAVMKQLNKAASEAMKKYQPHACTDVTGYGLAGHLYEMTEGSGLSARIKTKQLPLFPDVVELAKSGNMPGGLKTNRTYLKDNISIAKDVDDILVNIIHDPQTSGGLLIAFPNDKADAFVRDLQENSGIEAVIIGQFISKGESSIYIV